MPASIQPEPVLAGAGALTNTPLPLRADSQIAWPSTVVGICSLVDSWVWPPVPAGSTPAGVSRKGNVVAPCPPNR